MPLQVTSTAFGPGEKVPLKHTGDGANISPPIAWSGAPKETKEFALICDDPDAPTPQPWVHWVIYKLPAETTRLPEGIPTRTYPGHPVGGLQGINDFGNPGYGGPAPPKGHGVHHYHFNVYALKEPISLKEGATKAELLKAIQGKILDEGKLTGLYQR